MIKYERWGSFLPDKNGKDTVVTYVQPDAKLNDKVVRMKEEGVCTIENVENGMKITYRGTDRGAYLSLGDLQQAVIHFLNEIKNSAAMKRLMEQANI